MITQPMPANVMTPTEALLWLAERLPELRDPCPGGGAHILPYTSPDAVYEHNIGSSTTAPCEQVGCPGWVPKQGEVALYWAMNKAGWNLELLWVAEDYREYQGDDLPPFTMKAGERQVVFWKDYPHHYRGWDADSWLAAVKAIHHRSIRVS